MNFQRSFEGRPTFLTNDISVELDLSGYDIIPDDPLAYALIEKMKKAWDGKWLSEVAWPRKPFGLATDYFAKHKSERADASNVIKCIGRNRSTNYLKEKDVPQKRDHIGKYKVCIPGAYGGRKGQRRKTLPSSSVFVVSPGEIVTETYMVIDTFDSKKEADNLRNFLGTNFARYFLGLRKITQHIPRERWAWVPYLDMNQEWTDDIIFSYFKFSTREVEHIKRKVQEWS